MLNAERELAYLREAVPLIKNYLLSREPAWQLPGISGDAGQPFSMLSIGPILLMLSRLKARDLKGKALAELGEYEEKIFQNKIHNEISWKKKVGLDITSRARLWQAFLDDYHSDPQTAATSYSSAVAQRVILQLLWDELDDSGILVAPLQFMLQNMDAALRLIHLPGDFIWEHQLHSGFPKETFWYLYGKLI